MGNVLVFNPLSFVQVMNTEFFFSSYRTQTLLRRPKKSHKEPIDPLSYFEYSYLENGAEVGGAVGRLRQDIVSSRPGGTTE